MLAGQHVKVSDINRQKYLCSTLDSRGPQDDTHTHFKRPAGKTRCSAKHHERKKEIVPWILLKSSLPETLADKVYSKPRLSSQALSSNDE